jgi:uncharacterized protein (DUF488 family)
MPQVYRLNLPSASPKQQLKSKALWNDARSVENANFFTLGYTGKKIDEILASLKANGVRTLVDIRQFPISMYRPELSKNNFSALLEENEIHYAHFPQLGVPRDIRAKAIETGSRDVIWNWYDEHVVTSFIGSNLHFFLNCVEHPVALMCTEIDPQECHRHRLSLALEQMGMKGFDL